ncbi:hypothetical protein Goshw_005657 [Gossypium schwendimanii]|uniref:Uncharacterized protein n=1 Tax=Gossypium schwendimanii TaxID=34291 RepID=A0A7J9MAF2_GOSSC|nr:hypothetical protein [Gossypium schwendimanii]
MKLETSRKKEMKNLCNY